MTKLKVFEAEDHPEIFHVYEEGKGSWPLPPQLEVEGEVEVTVRLWSTAGGRSGRWEVRVGGERYGPGGVPTAIRRQLGLNDAPYCPMARFCCEGFVWVPGGREVRMRFPEGGEDAVIVQWGVEVKNWAAWGVRAVEDPVRGVLERMLRRARGEGEVEEGWSWAKEGEQGNLEVFTLGIWTREDLEERLGWAFPERGSGNRRWGARYLVGIDGMVWRVIDGVGVALVYRWGLEEGRGPGWLLSPYHPEQPVALWSGLYLLVWRSFLEERDFPNP